MKILSCKQQQLADAYTIKNEPILSIDLMERAATCCFNWIINNLPTQNTFTILCGIGNNGGDGLAIASMLNNKGIKVNVYLIKFAKKLSPDCATNLKRLTKQGVTVTEITNKKNININNNSIIVDAIFGSGLTRPIEGFVAQIIQKVNEAKNKVIAIDLPAGLFCEDNSNNNINNIVKANYTLTFQSPKLAMLFPSNNKFVGKWEVLDIGIHKNFINNVDCNNIYITKQLIQPILHNRTKIAHKGTFGHALLAVGSKGKIGAAILSAKACLRSGVGLLSIQLPAIGYQILQESVPEAMVQVDEKEDIISKIENIEKYDAIGVGPGIGIDSLTQQALKVLIQNTTIPLVLDADAINMLAQNKTWLSFLPPFSILTPHPKEFERLVGKWKSDYHRYQLQLDFSAKYQVYIILKGAHTSISTPNKQMYFNSTGNPGMATAGSGDVLTGIITSLVAQKYAMFESCILGVYLHGLAGDYAKNKIGEEAMIASDIIEALPLAFNALKKS